MLTIFFTPAWMRVPINFRGFSNFEAPLELILDVDSDNCDLCLVGQRNHAFDSSPLALSRINISRKTP